MQSRKKGRRKFGEGEKNPKSKFPALLGDFAIFEWKDGNSDASFPLEMVGNEIHFLEKKKKKKNVSDINGGNSVWA